MVFNMEDWKHNIRNAKILPRTRKNQRNGKHAGSNKNMKTIKPPINKVMNKVMKDSDSETDDEAEFPATADVNADWVGDPWANCAQPGQLIKRNIRTGGRPFNVIVTCNNGRTVRRFRKKFQEVYLAPKERDDYIELERQINEAVASYKKQDIPVPRRFFKSEMPVLAPFGDTYYRARIVGAHNSRCKVFFVDYGNEEEIVLNELIYPMQQQFAFLPIMAFPAWIPAGPKILPEGAELAVIAERFGAESIVQVRRYGPDQNLGTITEMGELTDSEAGN